MLQHKNLFHPRSQTQFFPLRIWINDEFLDNFLHLPSKKLSIPDSNQNETKRHDCSQIEPATPEQLIHPICKKKKSPNQDKKQKKKGSFESRNHKSAGTVLPSPEIPPFVCQSERNQRGAKRFINTKSLSTINVRLRALHPLSWIGSIERGIEKQMPAI